MTDVLLIEKHGYNEISLLINDISDRLELSVVSFNPDRRFFILFFASFFRRIWSGGSFNNWYLCYIVKKLRPKVIISFIDNNNSFYSLYKYIDIPIILVQNGLRNTFELSRDKRNYVDYFFVFSEAYKIWFSEFVSGSIIVHGSLRSNAVPIESIPRDDRYDFLVISEFRSRLNTNNLTQTFCENFRVAYSTIAKDKNLRLKRIAILLHEVSEPGRRYELEFFRSVTSSYDISVELISPNYCSYRALDRADTVVFFDSFLGYEALARGKKVFRVCSRGDPRYVFPHPYSSKFNKAMQECDYIFCNNGSVKDFSAEQLSIVSDLSDAEWPRCMSVKELTERYGHFDNGSLQLRAVLKDLLLG